jgi:glutamate synthase (NADPH/NADH) small chain
MKLRSSHAHEEGCEREWSVATTALSGEHGRLRALHAVRVQARPGADGRSELAPVAGTELVMEVDLVLLAMGFTGPTVATDGAHRTSVEGIFAAGDVRRGASLIVWAIREGRDAAAAMHRYLEALAPV